MINAYDMKMDSSGRWVRFYTKLPGGLPLDRAEEQSFFAANRTIQIDRNVESTPRESRARLSDYSDVEYSGHPVFSERARRALEPYLDGLGRWIELKSDEAPYWLFWMTNVVDALDEAQSKIAYFPSTPGKVMAIDSFVFKPDVIKDQFLFTLPQRRGSNRLVTDRFVEVVREHRLTGFSFEWLWSSDKGPRPLGLKDWEKPRITGLEGLDSP